MCALRRCGLQQCEKSFEGNESMKSTVISAHLFNIFVFAGLLTATPGYSQPGASVICSTENIAAHFVITPTNVLMIFTAGNFIHTMEYNSCFPIIPASPPKSLYSCSRKISGSQLIEYDVNDLTWIKLDGWKTKMDCAESVEGDRKTRLYN